MIPDATKSPPKVTKNASKGHQKDIKLLPKRAKVSPNDTQEQKYKFLVDFDQIPGTISVQLSITNQIEWLTKMKPKINAGKVLGICDQIIEKPYQNGSQIWS